jgi:HlyD family secretion protein
MRRAFWILVALIIAVAATVSWPRRPAAPPARSEAALYCAVAPGLIEPATEEREIGAEALGALREVLIEENDLVKAGQLVAVVKNDDQKAVLAQAKAQVSAARANLADVERTYKRDAVLEQNRTLPTATLERSRDRLDAAKAEVERATALVQQAQANLDKTLIRSPIDGVVLKKMVVAGGAVTNQPPTPIAILGDLSKLRVRADVDELDIGKVHQAQKVEIRADAFPGLRVGGTVARINKRLGARKVQTDRSNERADSKVLQLLVAIEGGAPLPVGLRVDVYFLQPCQNGD